MWPHWEFHHEFRHQHIVVSVMMKLFWQNSDLWLASWNKYLLTYYKADRNVKKFLQCVVIIRNKQTRTMYTHLLLSCLLLITARSWCTKSFMFSQRRRPITVPCFCLSSESSPHCCSRLSITSNINRDVKHSTQLMLTQQCCTPHHNIWQSENCKTPAGLHSALPLNNSGAWMLAYRHMASKFQTAN